METNNLIFIVLKKIFLQRAEVLVEFSSAHIVILIWAVLRQVSLLR